MGLESGSYVAYCFDQAITYLGSKIQGELDAIPPGKGKNAEKSRKKRQERLLQQLLGTEKKEPRKFRDPFADKKAAMG